MQIASGHDSLLLHARIHQLPALVTLRHIRGNYFDITSLGLNFTLRILRRLKVEIAAKYSATLLAKDSRGGGSIALERDG